MNWNFNNRLRASLDSLGTLRRAAVMTGFVEIMALCGSLNAVPSNPLSRSLSTPRFSAVEVIQCLAKGHRMPKHSH